MTSSAFTTTWAVFFAPGNASVRRLYVFITGVFCGMALVPEFAVCRPSAGIDRATRRPPEIRAAASGRLRTRSSIQDQTRDSERAAMRLPRNGIRPRSTLSPSFDSIAGRTVSEPSIATPTTRIVPVAIELKPLSPVRYMPAIAAMTVKPETRTVRPEVAAAASRAASGVRPALRSSRSRRM